MAVDVFPFFGSWWSVAIYTKSGAYFFKWFRIHLKHLRMIRVTYNQFTLSSYNNETIFKRTNFVNE